MRLLQPRAAVRHWPGYSPESADFRICPRQLQPSTRTHSQRILWTQSSRHQKTISTLPSGSKCGCGKPNASAASSSADERSPNIFDSAPCHKGASSKFIQSPFSIRARVAHRPGLSNLLETQRIRSSPRLTSLLVSPSNPVGRGELKVRPSVEIA